MVSEIKWNKAGGFPQKESQAISKELAPIVKTTKPQAVETQQLKLNHLASLINSSETHISESANVEEIKNRIHSNQYQIDFEKLSKRILESEVLSCT